MGIAAPVIVAEMNDWVALGGGNSGIVGDANHSFGFHVAADELPASDYSRTRDPNGSDGPYVNWDYACAGDFSHKRNETLRAMHRNVLARLMRGELSMICEFIGQPWADQPVYYWARWNGIGTLLRYTGSGHDHWSHISWYRSRVDQRAYLWVPQPLTTAEDEMKTWIVNIGTPGRYWTDGLLVHPLGNEAELNAALSQGAIDIPTPVDLLGKSVPHPTLPGVYVWKVPFTPAAPTVPVDIPALVAALTPALATALAPLLPKPLTEAQTVEAARKGANLAEDSA